jgi:MbtH protein
MTNPFEDKDATYHVLINNEGQYSLWPTFVEVPDGWTIVLNSNKRTVCLEYINRNWTDMRPKSLIAAMEDSNGAGQPDKASDAADSNAHDVSTGDVETLH